MKTKGNTLNRDKVIEILRNELYAIVDGQIDDGAVVITEGLGESADAICSLSLPVLDEEEIDMAFFKYASQEGDYGRKGNINLFLSKDNFELAIKELIKPKDE